MGLRGWAGYLRVEPIRSIRKGYAMDGTIIGIAVTGGSLFITMLGGIAFQSYRFGKYNGDITRDIKSLGKEIKGTTNRLIAMETNCESRMTRQNGTCREISSKIHERINEHLKGHADT